MTNTAQPPKADEYSSAAPQQQKPDAKLKGAVSKGWGRVRDKVKSGVTNSKPAGSSSPEPGSTSSGEGSQESAESKKKLANEKYAAGEYQESIKFYNEAITMHPTAALYANRGAANFMLGNYSVCIADCSQALKLDSKYGKALGRRGRALAKVNRLQEAYTDLDIACRIAPTDEVKADFLDVRRRLGMGGAQQQQRAQPAKVVPDHFKILEIQPTSDEKAIKKAYHQLALKWHPDKWQDGTEKEQQTATEKFTQIQDASDVLTDSSKRETWERDFIKSNPSHTPIFVKPEQLRNVIPQQPFFGQQPQQVPQGFQGAYGFQRTTSQSHKPAAYPGGHIYNAAPRAARQGQAQQQAFRAQKQKAQAAAQHAQAQAQAHAQAQAIAKAQAQAQAHAAAAQAAQAAQQARRQAAANKATEQAPQPQPQPPRASSAETTPAKQTSQAPPTATTTTTSSSSGGAVAADKFKRTVAGSTEVDVSVNNAYKKIFPHLSQTHSPGTSTTATQAQQPTVVAPQPTATTTTPLSPRGDTLRTVSAVARERSNQSSNSGSSQQGSQTKVADDNSKPDHRASPPTCPLAAATAAAKSAAAKTAATMWQQNTSSHGVNNNNGSHNNNNNNNGSVFTSSDSSVSLGSENSVRVSSASAYSESPTTVHHNVSSPSTGKTSHGTQSPVSRNSSSKGGLPARLQPRTPNARVSSAKH